ncbi:hypothetical protein V6N12_049013 [Hibiscus sabdariffa]|uniref:Uncharacterized protein n=1 Tax=Hibiscus sabdariffa TaxID=183260 RepID=A0ABR2EIY2_9ROSI
MIFNSGDCGALSKSVEEAQKHVEVTFPSNMSESSETAMKKAHEEDEGGGDKARKGQSSSKGTIVAAEHKEAEAKKNTTTEKGSDTIRNQIRRLMAVELKGI